MTKIALLCSAGMSTSMLVTKMLVTKMRTHETEIDKEIEIEAYPISEESYKASDANILSLRLKFFHIRFYYRGRFVLFH